MTDHNALIDEMILGIKESERLMTVSELGLDHSKCSYSTGIDDSLTAGQGALDHNGFWQIPCPECCDAMEKTMEQNRLRREQALSK